MHLFRCFFFTTDYSTTRDCIIWLAAVAPVRTKIIAALKNVYYLRGWFSGSWFSAKKLQKGGTLKAINDNPEFKMISFSRQHKLPSLKYTFFCQITTFIKVCVAFVLGLQTLYLRDFSKIYQLKGLKPKNKGHANFYECCDLTKKVYLV